MGKKENNKPKVKPFLKWVGGKSQLIKSLNYKLPAGIENGKIKKYFEPFVGGGALFFYLMSHCVNIEKAYISDTNEDLILTYNVIKESHEDLIIELNRLISKWPKTQEDRIPIYNDIRENFNKEKKFVDYNDFSNQKSILQAARLIFLNKTCFNGIYRVNSKGEFNVPIGRYKNPAFYDETNIKNISEYLQKTEIANKSYDYFKEEMDEESFVYLDPPYRPITKTSFISYTKSKFNNNNHIDLANFFREISENGAKVLLSNSVSQYDDMTDIFYKLYYRGFDNVNVPARRYVNRDGKNRGPVDEILIWNNYEVIKPNED